MTKTEIACEAFSAGQRAAGVALGMPFFLGSLLLLLTGRLALHGGPWGGWAMGYICLAVVPAAVYLSSAMATLAAPPGQERAYAKAPATGYVALLLSFAALAWSISLYALWPLTTGQQVWHALTGSPFGPSVPLLLGVASLVPAFGALGYAAGRTARSRPSHVTARLLKFCWRLSRKRPSDIAAFPVA